MGVATTDRAPAWTAALDRPTAMRLAATEYGRWLAQLRTLDAEDWHRPTDCAGWDVRAVAGHVLGMAEMVASVGELVHQNRAAARTGGGVDALTAVQVRARASLTPAEVVARTAAVAPRAVRGRGRLSRAGRLPVPELQVVGDSRERWTVGYLVGVVLTRDTWMHRIDVARATGRPLELTAGHDGVLVADVAREWLRRHGRDERVQLTGPAGGCWGGDDAADVVELDAVEFCRLLSGRAPGGQDPDPARLRGRPVPF